MEKQHTEKQKIHLNIHAKLHPIKVQKDNNNNFTVKNIPFNYVNGQFIYKYK